MTNPKILIVDDEPFNIDYLEQELADHDYDTLSASNGQEALEKVASESPDVVLLDIMMPVMDGFEVLSRLKANPSTRDIPIIVISASNDMQSVVKGVQKGAEDYLPKPFDPTLLHARIYSSLQKKRLRDLEQLYLKNIERELEIGREIQKGFLPAELPKLEGWEIGAYFKAAREVAGDFFDAFLLPDGNLVCVIGDVCGKGVGAALFMTLFRSLIRATATTDYLLSIGEKKGLTIQERLQHVIGFTNNYIARTHGDANMFATVFIGLIDPRDGSFSYINCGNDPPLLFQRDGKIISFPPTGPAVGVIEEAVFKVGGIIMNKGDLLLAFTDGIPDALDVNGNSFGNERITKIQTMDASPTDFLKIIEKQIIQHIGEADQFDDITVLAIKKVA